MPIDYRTKERPRGTPEGYEPQPDPVQRQPIPAANVRARPSPTFDPVGRMRLSSFAKWMLLMAIILF